ncbi:MAG: TonB-dependent receptor, partial [Caulobacterales bacterium]|nr:TonB-dependent receptor [Caulobacterales bacterium]
MRSHPLSGSYSLSRALDVLLEGTGLDGDLTDSGVIAISFGDRLETSEGDVTDAKIESNRTNRSLLASVSALVFGAGGAYAQEPASEETAEIPRIVVTAQKREQYLQDVPVSVRAFTSEELITRKIETVGDYVNFTPSFSLDQSGSPKLQTVVIRGIGGLGGSQATYGVYLDGFELTGGSLTGLDPNLDDVERLEVLRGPQGTTFGRNVVAGAINITSKTPDPSGFSGRIDAGVGNFGTYSVAGLLNAPLSETVAARVSGYYERSDGWIDNVGPSGGSNDVEEFGGRITVQAAPNERLRMRGTFLMEDYNQGLLSLVQNGEIGADTTAGFLRDAIIDPGFGLVPPGTLPAGPEAYYPDQNDTVSYNRPFSFDTQTMAAIGRLDYEFDDFSLVWISGYTGTERERQTDLDYSEIDSAFGMQMTESDFFSTELRLQSNGDRKLDWIAGVLAASSEASADRVVRTGEDAAAVTFAVFGPTLFGSVLPNDTVVTDTHDSIDRRSYSVFADVDYELTDQFSVVVGARYNYDVVEASIVDSLTILANAATPFPLDFAP